MNTNTALSTSVLPSAVLDRAALTRAVEIAANVADKRVTIPILSNVLLRSDGQTLFITSTDLDIALHVAVPGAADADFATTIPAHLFKDLLKGAPKADYVSLAVDSAESVSLDFETATYNVAALPTENFPDLLPGTFSHSFTLPGADLLASLLSVKTAISKEETRYYLNGIYMHAVAPHDRNRPELRFVATDGHRMMRQEITAPDGAIDMPGVIVPTGMVELLLKLLKGKNCPAEVSLEVSETKLRVMFDNVTIVAKMVEGTFPDYERVTPKHNDKIAVFSAKAVLAGIKAVSMIASERGGKAVRLTFEAGTCTMSCTDPDNGTATAPVGMVEGFDDYLEIGFNAKYLADLVKDAAADGDEVKFAFNDCSAPTVVTGAREGWMGVIMPMRT